MKAKFTMKSGRQITVDVTAAIRDRIESELASAEFIRFHEDDWKLILAIPHIESLEFE